jgi:hypothetical protein
MNKNNWHFWYEAEIPTGQAGQAPASDPNAPGQGGSVTQQQPANPPQDGSDPSAPAQPEDDVTQDPQTIETPKSNDKDFEQWRHDFMEMAEKCDNTEMMNSINSVRDMPGLESPQRKFVEDNFQIFSFRRDSNILKASTEIRNNIKKDLDRINPGTTVMQHLCQALDEQPLLYQNIIKMAGTFGWKSDLHRKWLAALMGAVQIGGGGVMKDLVYSAKDFNINFSTRFATQFGEINLSRWSLVQGDPKQYLKPDEQESLQEGSPEEKQVLRRKIIIKSIGEMFRKRAFLINVVNTDGTVYSIGWDLGNSLLESYKSGKIVVRGQESEDKEVLIGDDGNIIPVIDYNIMFVKETGEVDDDGRPETNEVPFIQRRDSILYLVADLDTIRTATAGMSGIFFKETPYGGNPAEILQLQRSVPGLFEIIFRQVV